MTQYHVIHNWLWLGAVESPDQAAELTRLPADLDQDGYKILRFAQRRLSAASGLAGEATTQNRRPCPTPDGNIGQVTAVLIRCAKLFSRCRHFTCRRVAFCQMLPQKLALNRFSASVRML